MRDVATPKWFDADGDTVFLPTGAPNSYSRDWRLATFAYVVQIPDFCVIPECGRDHFLNPRGSFGASEWKSGRFGGVREIQVSPSGAMPKVYYQAARSRFKAGLSETMYSSMLDVSDGPIREEPLLSYEETKRRAQFQRIEFPHNDEKTTFRLLEDDPGDSLHPTVRLRCVELCQFDEASYVPGELRDHAVQRYLVLHVYAEHLSNTQLESLARGIYRPRNKLSATRINGDAVAPGTKDPHVFQPLKLFTEVALEAINLEHTLSAFSMSNGGYLEKRKEAGSFGDRAGSDVRRQRKRTSGIAKPIRIACAIPGRGAIEEIGHPPEFAESETDGCWDAADAWAWQLASGADRFTEGIPAATHENLDKYRHPELKYWTLWSSGGGLAVVRKDIASEFDPRPWALASTRFVDLAMLAQRTGIGLQEMSFGLRGAGDDPSATVEEGAKEKTPEESLEKLLVKLQKLEQTQEALVHFRDYLWYEAIPGYHLDTEILTRFRDDMGITQMYGDFTDELDMRRGIFETQFNVQSVEEDKRRAKSRELAGERRERNNLIIGVAATALAVPTVLDTLGYGPSWPYFAGNLAVAGILLVLLWIYTSRDR